MLSDVSLSSSIEKFTDLFRSHEIYPPSLLYLTKKISLCRVKITLSPPRKETACERPLHMKQCKCARLAPQRCGLILVQSGRLSMLGVLPFFNRSSRGLVCLRCVILFPNPDRRLHDNLLADIPPDLFQGLVSLTYM